MKNKYYVIKDKKEGDILSLEYKKDGFKVSPKIRAKDSIKVDSIIFVSPSLTDKLIRKKINKKISKLLLELNTFYDPEETGDDEAGNIRNRLEEAINLKKLLINKYKKYLDGNYLGLTLKKLEVIIEGLNSRNNAYIMEKQKEYYMNMISKMNYSEELDSKKGKSR